MARPPRLDVPLTRRLHGAALRIRRAEERIRDLHAGGRMPGFIHLSIGQEGVAAGACAGLRPDDAGGSLRGLIAELFGSSASPRRRPTPRGSSRPRSATTTPCSSSSRGASTG